MKKRIRYILLDPRMGIFGILFLIWLISFVISSEKQFFLYSILPMFLLSILDIGITYIKTKKIYYPFSSLVSGLIIGILIHPTQGLVTILTAVLLTFFSKHFIKIKNRPVFNPAAIGILAATLINNTTVSWWMVAPGGIFSLLSILSFYILYKLKRLQYPVIFSTGYFLLLFVTKGAIQAVSLTLDGTVLFFAFIMMPEPMTSRITGLWKYGFPLVVLGIIIIQSLFHLTYTDQFLSSLLLANLLSGVIKKDQ